MEMAHRNGMEMAQGGLQTVPPARPAAVPHPGALGERRGEHLLYSCCPGGSAHRTSSPPRLIVPGPSSFPPITCFMSDPSLGCLLSEKSAAPTERQLPACMLRDPPCCAPPQFGGEGAWKELSGKRDSTGLHRGPPSRSHSTTAPRDLSTSSSAPAALPQQLCPSAMQALWTG